MRYCGLVRPAVLVLAILAWPGPAAAGGDPRAVIAFGLDTKPPPSYRGTWSGTSGQGEPISFTVDRRNRITRLRLRFEIKGDACTREVENELRGTVATIRNKRFTISRQTAQASFTITGRFASRTAVSGRLTGRSEGDCAGKVSTAWTARKGAKPPVDRSHDGAWEGPLTLAGVDPEIVTPLGGISFTVENGAVTFVGLPAVTRGNGCTAVRIPGLGQVFDPPLAIAGAGFSGSAEETLGWSFSVTGGFASAGTASGTVTISGSSGFPGVPGYCAGTVDGTWEATKK
jgi:hypothetical protein